VWYKGYCQPFRKGNKMNRSPILDKIVRNMNQRGYANVVRSGDSVLVTKTGGDVLTVTYVDKSVQSPMGGVSASAAPYLGIGVAAPGALKVKGAAAETTIAGIFDTVEALALLNELAGFANDIIVESGATTTELARLRGHETVLGLGM
jgi:hypothetical protein